MKAGGLTIGFTGYGSQNSRHHIGPELQIDHQLGDTIGTPMLLIKTAWGNKWAMRQGDWKLIGTTGRPQVTLHNLADARPEVKNYAKEKPELVGRLRMLHIAWAKDVTPKRQ